MKTNQELQGDVENAIKWEALKQVAEIGVTVKDGVVSLSGLVDSHARKLEAENAAKKVTGIKSLVSEIAVKLPSPSRKNNAEIAHTVLTALKNNRSVPEGEVTIKVEDGWVTLEGEVPWTYQKESAKKSVNGLTGVKGVTNAIKTKSVPVDAIDSKDIEDAIGRSLSIDASDVAVSVSCTIATLTGTVDSGYQKEEAARIARNTPGISQVKNELAVDYVYAFS